MIEVQYFEDITYKHIHRFKDHIYYFIHVHSVNLM